MATPEAHRLSHKRPALTYGSSGVLCDQAAANFLASLCIASIRNRVIELAGNMNVNLPPQILHPFELVTPDRVYFTDYDTIPGSLTYVKLASGIPASVMLYGPYAGLILHHNPQGDPQIAPTASHFWNNQQLRDATWRYCPANPNHNPISTSVPQSSNFHYQYCQEINRFWYNGLAKQYRTTSAAFCGLLGELGIANASTFNTVVNGRIY